MALSIEEVRKIATLARIELTPAEEARHAATISAVLDYMQLLNEVDTSAVEPTAQVTGLKNIVRDDRAVPGALRELLLAQMPAVQNDELAVPPVFE